MNEEMIALLREIRDLQKLHVENYKDALRNQQSAIEMQQRSARLQKRTMLGLLVFAVLVIAALAFSDVGHH